MQASPLDIRKKLKAEKTQNSSKKLKLKLKTQIFGIFQKRYFFNRKKTSLYSVSNTQIDQ